MYLRHKSLTKRTERRETIFSPLPSVQCCVCLGKQVQATSTLSGGEGGCLSTETVEKLLKLCECPKTFVTDCCFIDKITTLSLTQKNLMAFRSVHLIKDNCVIKTAALETISVYQTTDNNIISSVKLYSAQSSFEYSKKTGAWGPRELKNRDFYLFFFSFLWVEDQHTVIGSYYHVLGDDVIDFAKQLEMWPVNCSLLVCKS